MWLERATADEFARPSAGFGEPLRPAGDPEYRQGRSDQAPEQPGHSAPAENIRPVRRQRRSLLRRVASDVDPVRDRGLRHAVPAHLVETMASHQAKQEQQAGEPGYQFAWHRRLHDSHSGELGRPRADLVHPDMVAMAVAALRVVAEQQVGVLVRQQAGELSRGLHSPARTVRPRVETGPCPLSA